MPKKKEAALTPIPDYVPARRKPSSGPRVSMAPLHASTPAVVVDGPDLSHISPDLRALAVRVDTLTFLRCNPKKHQPEDIEALSKLLAKFGQRKPVVVNDRSGEIEAGNGTLAAACLLGWEWIARVRVSDDPKTQAEYSICDNRASELSAYDIANLDDLLTAIGAPDPEIDSMLHDLAEEAGLLALDPIAPTGSQSPAGNGAATSNASAANCSKCGQKLPERTQ